jgi:acetylcholinesterase
LNQLIPVTWPYLNTTDETEILGLYPNVPSFGVPYGEFDNSSFPQNGTQWRRVASIVGDEIMIAPTRLFCNISAFAQNQTVYRYRANLTYPGIPAQFGSTHGIEIPYVWNFPTLQLNNATAKTAEFVSRAWTSFIQYRNPNNHGIEGIPVWRPYSANSSGENFVIGVNNFTTELDTFRADGINFMNSAIIGES